MFNLLIICFLPNLFLAATFNIRDFGAKGDGKTLDTTAIRRAFAAAESAGGGLVLVPSPGHYLTAPFNLTSDTTLQIDEGASILGAQDKTLYPIIAPLPSYGRSRDVGYTRHQALVFGVGLKNVKILGGGTIDGQGSYWWDLHKRGGMLKSGRPRLIEVMWTDGLEIGHVTLKNPGFWNVHPIYSTNIWIHDVKISSPSTSPNTDGIDPDSSSNVLIEHCTISCGDDHIAIKSGMDEAGLSYNWPTANVTIRHCDFHEGDGISIGSETSGGIWNVLVHDCVTHAAIIPAFKGTYIKTGRGRGNVVRDIRYENLRFELVSGPVIDIDMNWGHAPPTHNVSTTPVVRDVSFVNITGNGLRHGRFFCLPESPCRGISLSGVRTRGLEGWDCENAFGSQVDVHPESCLKKEEKGK